MRVGRTVAVRPPLRTIWALMARTVERCDPFVLNSSPDLEWIWSRVMRGFVVISELPADRVGRGGVPLIFSNPDDGLGKEGIPLFIPTLTQYGRARRGHVSGCLLSKCWR